MNAKKINKLISTVCLVMMMVFVATAAILSSHDKVGDSKDDIPYHPIVTTTTTTESTTTSTTTTTTTTSTTETTTTETTAAYIAAPSIEFPEDVTYQELTNITVVETYTEAVNYEQPEPATEDSVSGYSYASVCDKVTYYGDYGYAAVGASGNQLITGYSCACDLYPFGTILYVETSDGAFAGYVRVDDRVSERGNSTIVDIYYERYDMVPYSMYDAGAYTTYYINEWHPTCIINVVG